MDGVLVYSEDAWFLVYNETLARFGHAPISRGDFDAIYGNGTEADRGTYMPERTVAEIDAAYAELFERHLDEIRPNPEATAVLAALRERGIRTAVATNTNQGLARRILGRFDLLGSFDALASANEAGASKPDPAVLHLAARLLAVSLRACLFVGDSLYDEEASRRAAVPFVGYRYGDERIESLAELLERATLRDETLRL